MKSLTSLPKRLFKSIYKEHTIEHFGNAIVVFFGLSAFSLLLYSYFWVWQKWH